jgi:hypothetical protein
MLRRFLAAVTSREDYPGEVGYLPEDATDEQVVALAKKVLKVRKATEYGPLVIAECSAAELPPTLVKLMLGINTYLEAKTSPASMRHACGRPPKSSTPRALTWPAITTEARDLIPVPASSYK